jgi:hypothetical protein
MLGPRGPTKGIHRKMLRENQRILALIRSADLVKPKLDLTRVLIRGQSEIKKSTL